MKRAIKPSLYILFAVFAYLTTSCVRDKRTSDYLSSPTSQEVSVELRLQPAQGFFGSTRATTADQESEIANAVVLFFRGTDENAPLYAVSEGKSISVEADGGISFQATLAVEAQYVNTAFSCVVLANVLDRPLKEILGNSYTITVDGLQNAKGMTYSALQSKLYTEIKSPLEEGDGNQTFPMYGRSTTPLIPSTARNQQFHVSLVRDVARIHLMNTATQDFTLTEAYIYRASNKRAYVPTADAFHNSQQPTVVKQPSLPAGTSPIAIGDPWYYAIQNNQSLYEMYLPEADTHVTVDGKPGDLNHENRCAVVVGGLYKGQMTYYRIDFTLFAASGGSQGERSLIDVMRNHSYNITITAVNSSGEQSPEEAYKSTATNIVATIIPWEDENQDIVFDGANWASVNRKRIEFADGADLEALLNLLSNISPSSWKMAFGDSAPSSEKSLTGTFFSVTKPDDNSDTNAAYQGGNLVIRTLTACPEGSAVREEQLHIFIGRLELIVTLVQNPYTDIPWEDGGEFPGEF